MVKLHGWHFDIPDLKERPEVFHCVLTMMPHTCIADFFVGAAVLWQMGTNPRIFMKKEFFNFFTARLLRKLGVVSVDRGNRNNNLVQQAVQELRSSDNVLVVITPEATRKPVKRLKRGFYDIATQAGVPIVMGYIDFGRHVAGVGPTLVPSGDFDADCRKMVAYASNITPGNPKGWGFGKALPENQETKNVNE